MQGTPEIMSSKVHLTHLKPSKGLSIKHLNIIFRWADMLRYDPARFKLFSILFFPPYSLKIKTTYTYFYFLYLACTSLGMPSLTGSKKICIFASPCKACASHSR